MHVLTKQGNASLARQQVTGIVPQVTRIVAGEGIVAPEDLEELTDIPQPIAEMEYGDRELVDSRVVRLTAQLSNMALSTTALIRLIGVYCQYPGEEEFLYQVQQYNTHVALESVDAMKGVTFFEPELNILFANAEQVTIGSTPGFLVTKDKLEEKLRNIPRVYVCTEEPEEWNPGDFWYQVLDSSGDGSAIVLQTQPATVGSRYLVEGALRGNDIQRGVTNIGDGIYIEIE